MSLAPGQQRELLKRVSREIVVGGRVELIDELFASDFLDHDALPGLGADREGFGQAVKLLRGALPDLEVDMRYTLVEGDKVADYLTSAGTHLGEFMGIAPTGKRVTVSALEILRIDESGRVAERWQRFGAMQLLQQIGAIPGWQEPPQAPPVPVVEGGLETSIEENKRLMTSQLRIWNDGDYDLADELFHPASVTPDAPQFARGPEGCKAAARMFRKAFPDFHMTVEDVIAENDLVLCRFRQTGTHRGELFELPPTGKSVDFEEIALCQLAGGQIVATWFQTDMLGLMQQLGVSGA
jgi:predicted ester cyclase